MALGAPHRRGVGSGKEVPSPQPQFFRNLGHRSICHCASSSYLCFLPPLPLRLHSTSPPCTSSVSYLSPPLLPLLCPSPVQLTETDEFTRRFRYQKYNLPYGINEDVVLYYLAQWQLTDPNTDLQEVVAIGNTQEPDETGRTLLGLMEMYNADHGGGVCMKDFVQVCLVVEMGPTLQQRSSTRPFAGGKSGRSPLLRVQRPSQRVAVLCRAE